MSPAAGSRWATRGIAVAFCKAFDHGAVSVTIAGSNTTNWYTTQFPFFVPEILPPRIFGPLSLGMLTGTRTIVRNRKVSDTDAAAINRGLTNWTNNGRINVADFNRPLRSGEVDNCFAMMNWAFKFAGGTSGSDPSDLIAPTSMFGPPSVSSDVRNGAINPPPGAIVTTIARRNTATMENHTEIGRSQISSYSHSTYNTNGLLATFTAGGSGFTV